MPPQIPPVIIQPDGNVADSSAAEPIVAEVHVGGSSSLPRTIYGGVLVLAAVGATVALAISYIPTREEPQAQAAAVAAPEEISLFKDIEIGGRAGYVYDVTAQKELYSKSAHVQLPLASITKVVLMLAVSEVLAPEDLITISRTALERGEGGLTWGEEWRMRDLLDYTLITSSNTGAEALAEAADARLRAKYADAPVGGAAVWRMNAIAQELGLSKTYFINASGLDESPTQAGALGSAHDIARLFEYSLQSKEALFSATTRSAVQLAPVNYLERLATNTNNALADIDGIRMGKTGTTDLAGGNLAIAFDAEGHTFIVVVLGATPQGRFIDVMKLVETARKSVSTGSH